LGHLSLEASVLGHVIEASFCEIGWRLTERIFALAGDRELCVSLGARARMAFERQWDKEKALTEWHALLQAVGHPIVSKAPTD
jgi:hypothetical protein